MVELGALKSLLTPSNRSLKEVALNLESFLETLDAPFVVRIEGSHLRFRRDCKRFISRACAVFSLRLTSINHSTRVACKNVTPVENRSSGSFLELVACSLKERASFRATDSSFQGFAALFKADSAKFKRALLRCRIAESLAE